MKIAFLYIAEAYQCYHGASIALELAGRHDVEVVSYYNDPQSSHHLERIRQAYDATPIPIHRLRRSWLTRLLQSALRRFGMFKMLVMWDNRTDLNSFDAIFAVEDTVCFARRLGITHPKLILLPHGFGDRARGFTYHTKAFDFVLVAGPKIAKRMLDDGLISGDGYAMVGAVKFDVCAKLQQVHVPLFKDARPVVLYNAHKAPKLTSWPKFIAPMLEDFAAQDAFNLIVAPHVKMFRRQDARRRASWESRSTDHLLIDTGSDRLLDMTYTNAADIYVGDVSSQVYEFLARPRPCIFLNAHGVDWQGDPNFVHWQLGDVVDDPRDLMAAIRAAPARHALYRAKQEELAEASLGQRQGATIRAADAILDFMRR
jgi:hypothetical protein